MIQFPRSVRYVIRSKQNFEDVAHTPADFDLSSIIRTHIWTLGNPPTRKVGGVHPRALTKVRSSAVLCMLLCEVCVVGVVEKKMNTLEDIYSIYIE